MNGTTRMRSGKKRQHHNHHNRFHTVSHYSFFRGSPRWPASKFSLTYAFLPGTRGDAINPVARAFQTWAPNTQFQFAESQDYRNADIKISFESGDHGAGALSTAVVESWLMLQLLLESQSVCMELIFKELGIFINYNI